MAKHSYAGLGEFVFCKFEVGGAIAQVLLIFDALILMWRRGITCV